MLMELPEIPKELLLELQPQLLLAIFREFLMELEPQSLLDITRESLTVLLHQ